MLKDSFGRNEYEVKRKEKRASSCPYDDLPEHVFASSLEESYRSSDDLTPNAEFSGALWPPMQVNCWHARPLE